MFFNRRVQKAENCSLIETFFKTKFWWLYLPFHSFNNVFPFTSSIIQITTFIQEKRKRQEHICERLSMIITARQQSCGSVMFSQVSVWEGEGVLMWPLPMMLWISLHRAPWPWPLTLPTYQWQLVAFTGDLFRLVHYLTVQSPPPHWHWYMVAIKACTVDKRAVRIILECFLVVTDVYHSAARALTSFWYLNSFTMVSCEDFLSCALDRKLWQTTIIKLCVNQSKIIARPARCFRKYLATKLTTTFLLRKCVNFSE